jgi:hypothetical protein
MINTMESTMDYGVMNTAFYNEDYEDNYDEYCPEGWNDDEEYVDIYEEWPDRGRFGTLPSISFLVNNNFGPMTEPERIDPYFIEQHKLYKESIAKMYAEKKELVAKCEKVQEELKKAEDVPKTYSAAKWGAISSRDALVKRLTNDYHEADRKVQEKNCEINYLTASKKTLCDYIVHHEETERLYKEYIEEKEKSFEELYGKVEPLTDPAFTHLFFDAEKVVTEDGSERFYFPNQIVLEKCMRACKLGGLKVQRVGVYEIQFV